MYQLYNPDKSIHQEPFWFMNEVPHSKEDIQKRFWQHQWICLSKYIWFDILLFSISWKSTYIDLIFHQEPSWHWKTLFTPKMEFRNQKWFQFFNIIQKNENMPITKLIPQQAQQPQRVIVSPNHTSQHKLFRQIKRQQRLFHHTKHSMFLKEGLKSYTFLKKWVFRLNHLHFCKIFGPIHFFCWTCCACCVWWS